MTHRTRRPADDLRRQIEAIDSMPWKELRDSLRLALVELAEVKPALHDALCERDEAKAHVVCLEALLREKTQECDELDEERREAWQHVLAAPQLAERVRELEVECAALRREIAALMDDH
jgi:predicted glycoside hydrolase/deacetylase ChbG (UPF0249 family)